MIFIGDVLVCALWAVQNVPYMVVIGDVFVYVAQNIHPGGRIAFQDGFVFASRAAQNNLYMMYAAQNIHPGGRIAFQDGFVFALGAAQKNLDTVYVAQNIHPGGRIAFQDDFVFALRAAQNILYTNFIVLVFAIVKRVVFFLF